jgi:purine-cytosine permease-like protein
MNDSDESKENIDNEETKLISEFFDYQKQQILLDQGKQDLAKMHMQNQAAIANRSLDIQEKLLSNAPAETRKTRGQYLWFGSFFLVILLVFVGYCLTNNFGEFLEKLIQPITTIITLFIGYYFGKQKSNRKNTKNDEDTDIEDVEIVDED